MIPYRTNFHKVYDLTERVLPEGIDKSLPSSEEYARFLINRYLLANGLGQACEIAYLRKETKTIIAGTLENMISNGELLYIKVSNNNYFVLPDSLELLSKPLPRSKLKILSPFDNLLIQRKRMQSIFGFDYQIECYIPEAKRKYGYFSLPILWQGKFVARMDCKVDRKKSLLHIHHLFFESILLKKIEPFLLALSKELNLFLQFNNCTQLKLHQTTPGDLKSDLEIFLNNVIG